MEGLIAGIIAALKDYRARADAWGTRADEISARIKDVTSGKLVVEATNRDDGATVYRIVPNPDTDSARAA